MSFKKIYKAANDSIEGNRNLIDAIYEKAERKKSFFVLNYRQLSLCAAALLLIITMSVFHLNKIDNDYSNRNVANDRNIISNTLTNETKEGDNGVETPESAEKNKTADKISDDNEQKNLFSQKGSPSGIYDDKVIENTAYNDDTASKEVVPDTSAGSNQVEVYAPSADYEDSDKTTGLSVSESTPAPVSETSPEMVTTMEEKSKKAISNDNDKLPDSNTKSPVTSGASSTGSRGGGGGGGGSSAGRNSAGAKPSTNPTTVVMSSSEYFDYLTMNVADFSSFLPDGLKLEIPTNISVVKDDSTGTYIYDEAQFTALNFNSPEEILTISTSRLGGDIKNTYYANRERSVIINNNNFVIITEANFNQAYFEKGNVWLSILSYGIPTDEFIAFLKNI